MFKKMIERYLTLFTQYKCRGVMKKHYLSFKRTIATSDGKLVHYNPSNIQDHHVFNADKHTIRAFRNIKYTYTSWLKFMMNLQEKKQKQQKRVLDLAATRKTS